jgi:hypothetical protein
MSEQQRWGVGPTQLDGRPAAGDARLLSVSCSLATTNGLWCFRATKLNKPTSISPLRGVSPTAH